MSDSARSPLTLVEYAAVAVIVVIWGVNNAAAKIATEVIPPMAVGALRFLIGGLCLLPFVRPPFPNWKALLVLALCGGPIHFGLIYLAFGIAEDLSPLAVSLQLWIPLAALFSWLILGERLTRATLAGLVIAFAGVAWMTLDPHALQDWDAILLGIVASAAWAVVTVVARRTTAIPPLKMQGVICLVAAPSLAAASLSFEHDPLGAIGRADALVWACVLWAALVSTLGATCLLFWLVQRREAGRVTPYMLTTPLVSVLIGVAFLGDVLTPQIVEGAAACIGGVGLVALAERRFKARALKAAAAVSPD
jgi:O-acetylserine/cysteine efflux transporter